MTTVSRTIGALRRRAILALILAPILALVAAAAASADPARAESPATPHDAAQIEALVAPIALYPDGLLAQVLMASTYPLEVVEAARWSRQNAGVTGQALEDALQKQSWDPSVKALTALPQTLQLMSDKLDWTQLLGDTFLARQKDVLDAVQRLRARADAARNLKSTNQQKVTKTEAPRPATRRGQCAPPAPAVIYTIEPANPNVYSVPIYNPGIVYGTWPYLMYAPFHWYPPGYVANNVFSFAAGVAVGSAIWGNIDWRRRRVDIDVDRFNRFNRTNIASTTWVHNPEHRRGVPYRDANVARRFTGHGKADAARRNLPKQGVAKPGAARKRHTTAAAPGKRESKAKTGAKSKTTAKSKRATKSPAAARSRRIAKPKHARSVQAAPPRAAPH